MFLTLESSIWVAHNSSIFDHVFVLKWLLERKKGNPFTVMSGNKIMVLRYVIVTILDCYLFFNTKLADLPHCMGIKDSRVKKGFHPYLFMDLDYVGGIVDKHFFDTSSMDDETG